MKKVKVNAYETSDGKVFTDMLEAKDHQEWLDEIPDTYPFLVRMNMMVEVVWDLEIDPEDPQAEQKVKTFMEKHLDHAPNKSLSMLANNELQYATVVGGVEFVSAEADE